MQNKCTLLIDGNWLMQSRFHVLSKKFKKDNPEHIKEAGTDELVDLMARSINLIINRFPVIDNMILVSDGGSWRKQISIPQQLKDQTYKGNRHLTNDFDWSYIYKSLDILIDIFNKNNITTSRHLNLEGDDWIWYWSQKLNREGVNVMIWSIDNDLKQLVNIDKTNGSITAWYNNDTGLFLHNDLNINIDPIDFFMQPEIFNPTLEELKKRSQSTTYILPDNIITSKIICGDSGDNIKPVFSFLKGSRRYKITEKDWGKISNKLNISSINDLMEKKQDISKYISTYSKYIHTDSNEVELINEMIDYNIKLVWLHESIIPKQSIDYMEQVNYNICDMGYLRKNFKLLTNMDNSDIEKLFEND